MISNSSSPTAYFCPSVQCSSTGGGGSNSIPNAAHCARGGQTARICRSADVVINVSAINPIRPWLARVPLCTGDRASAEDVFQETFLQVHQSADQFDPSLGELQSVEITHAGIHAFREQLDREKIPYEYLDGKTVDRQSRVERFQSDDGCKLFLISLKAGGLGLNLTAADYVFLLDPWWNPAVEAQAIDRTHRIGQTKQVYACRLIAKDTVEEKVLALQQSKRALADAIISEENSVIRTLGREDLELLLS